MRLPIAIFGLLCALIFVRSAAWSATAHDALRAQLQNILNAHLLARAKPEHISAISLSVSLHAEPANINVVAGRFSLAADAKPITPQTLFQIGSNTKAFTAAVVLQLEAEHKLLLDQTVGDRLPEYPAWRAATIRQLLDMTSGIPEYLDSPGLLAAEALNIHRRWSVPQLIGWVDPVYGHAPPMTHGWTYSNTGYLLAQLIVERVTGSSFGTQLAERLLGSKYGLENTYYSSNVYPQTVLDRMASGYFWNTDPGNEKLKPLLGADLKSADMSWAQAAGGMVGTPEDLTHWVRALYTGAVLEPKGRRELTTIVSNRSGKPILQTSLDDPLGFGLGVGQSTRAGLGTFWYYQGETLGYRVLYFYFPETDLVFAVGLNSAPTERESRAGLNVLIKNIFDAIQAPAKKPVNL